MNTIKFQQGPDGTSSESEYDNAGELLRKTTRFLNNGSVETIYSPGRIPIKKVWVNSQGVMVHHTAYDGEGRHVEVTTYDENGIFTGSIEYTYSEDGKKVDSLTINEEGVPERLMRSIINPRGLNKSYEKHDLLSDNEDYELRKRRKARMEVMFNKKLPEIVNRRTFW